MIIAVYSWYIFGFVKRIVTIKHDILLYKLEYYGYRGVALDWVKSYLSNRKQFVRYQMHDSNHKSIHCGVLQGSILGPLLFILYINDILNTTSLLELELEQTTQLCYFPIQTLPHKVTLLITNLGNMQLVPGQQVICQC